MRSVILETPLDPAELEPGWLQTNVHDTYYYSLDLPNSTFPEDNEGQRQGQPTQSTWTTTLLPLLLLSHTFEITVPM